MDGRLAIDEPWNNLNKAFPDLSLVDYVILVNEQEVAMDKIGFNVVVIYVKEDSQTVENTSFV